MDGLNEGENMDDITQQLAESLRECIRPVGNVDEKLKKANDLLKRYDSYAKTPYLKRITSLQ